MCEMLIAVLKPDLNGNFISVFSRVLSLIHMNIVYHVISLEKVEN